MSRTSSSFLIPFLMTLVVTLAIGLSWLYFGYYSHNIATYTELALNGHDSTVETTFMDTDNPEPGESESPNTLDTDLEDPGSEKKPAKTDPVVDSKETLADQKKNDPGEAKKNVSPKNKRTKRPAATNKTSRERPSSASAQQRASRDNTQSADQKPAFPNTRNKSDSKEFSGGSEEEDNPLLRALKQAGERQNNTEQKPDSGDPQKNPFEFLLNKEQQTE